YQDDLGDVWSENEDDSDDSVQLSSSEDEYAAVRSGVKKKPKKSRGRVSRADQEPSTEVQALLGMANESYLSGAFEDAVRLLEEIIRIDSHVYKAFKLLATIYIDKSDKIKALTALSTAALIKPKSKEDWDECYQLGYDLGNYQDAIVYCSRSLAVNSSDVSVLYRRAMLYKMEDNLSRAAEDFCKILKLQPYNTTVIMELAIIYVSQNRLSQASKLYEDLLQDADNASSSQDSSGSYIVNEGGADQTPVFGWSELNILAEIYVKQRAWAKIVKTIKYVSRWIHGRADEKWWDDLSNDAEFDERKENLEKFTRSAKKNSPLLYQLPVDLRVKLGFARLHLNDSDEAKLHFGYILDEDVGRYSDLYFEIGDALSGAGFYHEALDYYLQLYQLEQGETPTSLALAIAKCYLYINDLEQAEMAYKYVQSRDPTNFDAQFELADLYARTNRNDEAKELLDYISLQRKKLRDPSVISDDDEKSMSGIEEEQNNNGNGDSIVVKPEVTSFFEGNSQSRRGPAAKKEGKKYQRRTEEEKIVMEAIATDKVMKYYARLKRFDELMKTGSMVAVHEWLHVATLLSEEFMKVRKFFPSDKRKIFRGVIVTHKRRTKLDLDQRIQQLSDKISNSLSDVEEDDDAVLPEGITEFRGITFDEWFDLFMQYALVLTRNDEYSDASNILRTAKTANVFYQNSQRVEWAELVHISCAFLARDYTAVNELTRNYLNNHQFYTDALRLFVASLPSGNKACDIFSGANNHKYLLRQIKASDSIIQNKSIVGAAKILNSELKFEREHALLLVMYGQCMILGKSYAPSLPYLLRAVSVAPKDPQILLSIALAHIHRAIQRQTTNRHMQIVQGLTYMVDYYKIRSKMGIHEHQEAAYNMARSYHMLGLNGLAFKYYEEVLSFKNTTEGGEIDDDYDLKMSAAYNLQLIYTISGNGELARKMVDDYLTI
ncbi:TPR-like protein, partial [Nadsonia fulvescens var. elongata DSM 6958]